MKIALMMENSQRTKTPSSSRSLTRLPTKKDSRSITSA